MSAWKSAFATLLLALGLSSPAHAQFAGRGAVVGGYSPYGYSSGYNGFGNSGYSGFGSNYGGYGYGSGVGYGGFYRTPYVPQTYNNLGGLGNVIRQNTGKSGSYQYGTYPGVSRPRRGR